MRWSSVEIAYLTTHADEGTKAIAEALGRSEESVRQQAKTYGVSLRRRWMCPNCGQWSLKPLNSRTGFCAPCTKEKARYRLEDEAWIREREVERNIDANRKRQAVYSRRNRSSN